MWSENNVKQDVLRMAITKASAAVRLMDWVRFLPPCAASNNRHSDTRLTCKHTKKHSKKVQGDESFLNQVMSFWR